MRTLPYREPSALIACWQLLTTGALFTACLWVLSAPTLPVAKALSGVVLAGLLIRLFIFQHDCGHRSLFRHRASNAVVGHCISFVTTVPFTLWAREHDWHHRNQGKLDRRGIDLMNSPMTVTEAGSDPEGRRTRRRYISVGSIFGLGAYSLMVERKSVGDFFMFRPAYRWPVPDERRLRHSIVVAHGGSLGVHLVAGSWMGWGNWLCYLLPAYVLGAGAGSLLFWLQHNFEQTYFEPSASWSHEQVALRGSSYLRLPALLNWFSGSIGLHHVHHLNPAIPNYRLEEARRALPELAAVPPLSWQAMKDAFVKIFWDEDRKRMVALEE